MYQKTDSATVKKNKKTKKTDACAELCYFVCIFWRWWLVALLLTVFFYLFSVVFVRQEGIKAKKNLATDKTADELNAIFEPGQDFGFDATLDLEEDSGDAEAKPEAATSESEVVSA
jgi:hypothetical protein